MCYLCFQLCWLQMAALVRMAALEQPPGRFTCCMACCESPRAGSISTFQNPMGKPYTYSILAGPLSCRVGRSKPAATPSVFAGQQQAERMTQYSSLQNSSPLKDAEVICNRQTLAGCFRPVSGGRGTAAAESQK